MVVAVVSRDILFISNLYLRVCNDFKRKYYLMIVKNNFLMADFLNNFFCNSNSHHFCPKIVVTRAYTFCTSNVTTIMEQ